MGAFFYLEEMKNIHFIQKSINTFTKAKINYWDGKLKS